MSNDMNKKKKKQLIMKLKEEIAGELGLNVNIAKKGWANLTSRETGKIGGYVAKRLKEEKR
ncbi:MAG: small, acid-soluble spore protein, alpha/beta type [Dethiobacteria bacterium]|jgi:small acid-soluble spore protein F (minor alpha/beta-type SASP)